MIDRSGHLWITDFGLARLLDDPGVTMTNDLLGTIRYMSPEMARDVRPSSTTGPTLFSGRDALRIARALASLPGLGSSRGLAKDPRRGSEPLRRLDRTIPVDLETIIHKTINKDPERRYATAGDMAEDLRR